MISTELLDLIKESLPQIDDAKADDIKKRIKQFYEDKTLTGCFEEMDSLPLLQGDILDKLDLVSFDEENDRASFISSAVIISTSCDVQEGRNKKNVLVAPVTDLTEHNIPLNSLSDTLVKNLLFDQCYIVSNDFKRKLIIDFSLIQPYPLKLLYEKYKKDSNFKKATLTIFGKYLFITKLLIYIGRYEDPKESQRTIGKKKIPFLLRVKLKFTKNVK